MSSDVEQEFSTSVWRELVAARRKGVSDIGMPSLRDWKAPILALYSAVDGKAIDSNYTCYSNVMKSAEYFIQRSAPHYRSKSLPHGGARWLDTGCMMLILCSGLFVVVGCSQKEPVEGSRSSNVSPAFDSDPAVPSTVEPIVAAGDTTETARLWSDSIKSQLAQIEVALLKDDSTDVRALAKSVEMVDPELLQAKEVYHGQSVKVVELTPPAGLESRVVQSTTDEFIKGIRKLLCLTTTAAQEHAVHFKLYGINRDGEYLKTKQRLTARGTREGKRAWSYAVVDAKWVTTGRDGDEKLPRLVGFSMPVLVLTELIAEPAVMFEDIASSVLGRNPAWSEQLRLGMNIWGRHIDRSLNPDFLGYHGLAIGDVDGDDLEDLYLCQPGGLPNLLFRQQVDGTYTDISRSARVDWLDNSTGALLVDLDNDGDADLAVATRTAFLVMENDGTGKFALRERYSSLGMGYSPTAADYDLDGDLDILVLRYAGNDGTVGDFPTPHPFHSARNGGANVLLQNQGEFGFRDVTDDSGLGVENYRFSFAASWEDYDNDGDLDLYVANDFGPNQLFRNEGHYFIDESRQSGTQDWGFGMSATWADYDRDGYMDLYVSSMFSGAGNQVVPQADFNPSMPEETRRKYLKMVRGNTLLRNFGQGRFSDVTNPMAEGFGGWAWGSKFADLNNDGWEDLYVANGYVSQPDTDDL